MLALMAAFVAASAARELSQEQCSADTLKFSVEVDENGLPANQVADACSIESVWVPKRGKRPPISLLTLDACKEAAWNVGINYVPFYPPHFCANQCPTGLVPCCVWTVTNNFGGHTCMCYKRGCPVRYTPKNADSPL
ncbi:hypothetical protein OEZ85_010514 [Tetradesmus obliquus]|uniref:Uncharacterized protein n=1 Tax=Tetradesmus obliquus TaxID=3088 RepID=A0ABY8TPM4_TETOB|nr:hypothetical protein OEZ85_010514 [Tetradesmus obliquus]